MAHQLTHKRIWSICTLVAALAVTVAAYAVRVGGAAPDFTGTDSNGKTQKLSEYRGKYVILEWTNKDCPYTKKHYESGNMQALQKEWTSRGVVWLTVLSSAKGEQGYLTAEQENAFLAKAKASPSAVVLDPSGTIGHEYAAKTTPHMFIVDPSGKLIYDGAIDDHATTEPGDIKSSKNYVSAALTEAMSDKVVSTAYTRPYGCSVKYQGE